MSPEQCLAARALLDWKQTTLSQEAGVGVGTIKNFERKLREVTPNNKLAIEIAFIRAGIVFANDLSHGVAMLPPKDPDGSITHRHLLSIMRVLPTDYTDYGGEVERWADPDLGYPDCSGGCRWALWLAPPLSGDWLVCTKPGAPRSGLLTFEHQTGEECFEPEEDDKCPQ